MSDALAQAAARQDMDAFIGQLDTADDAVLAALRAEGPADLPPAVLVALARVRCGRGDALAAARTVEGLDPSTLSLAVRAGRAIVLAEAAVTRWDAAAAIEHALDALRADPMAERASRIGLQMALASGDLDRAAAVVAGTESGRLSRSPVLLGLAACVHARQGQADAALDTAQRALALR